MLCSCVCVCMCVFLQEKKRTEAALNELRRGFETEACELQCKIQRMQLVNVCFNNYSAITVRFASNTCNPECVNLSTDRRKVQEHHGERREPSVEEKDQWANTGETGWFCPFSTFCMSVSPGFCHTFSSVSPFPLCRRTSGWNRTCWRLRPKSPVCTVRWTRWRRS